jgi:hypothetical protein
MTTGTKDKKTTVINISKASLINQGYDDLLQWQEDANHIYIGRAVRYVPGARKSKWANPFSKKVYGHQKCVEMYRDYILQNQELLADVHELKGKVLGCWCKPGPCHGDILSTLADQAE